MLLDTHNICIYLSQKNLLFWAEKQDLQIREVGSKNFSFQVTIPNQTGYFLKQSKSRNPIDIAIFEWEAYFYSWVGQTKETQPIRELLPTFYGYDPNHHILIFSLLENTKSLAKYLKTNTLILPLSQKLGIIMSHFQQLLLNTDIPLPKTTSHPFFKIENPDVRTDLGRTHQLAQQLAENIANNPILCRGIQDAATMWETNGLLHKDIKFENWLINPQTQQLYLIDWEDASIGDVHWDLACMLRSLIMHHLFKQKAVFLMGLTPFNPVLDDKKNMQSIKAFLRGYTTIFDEPTQQKIILFLAVSLLQKIVEMAQGGSQLDLRNVQFMGIAEDLIKNPSLYTKHLFHE